MSARADRVNRVLLSLLGLLLLTAGAAGLLLGSGVLRGVLDGVLGPDLQERRLVAQGPVEAAWAVPALVVVLAVVAVLALRWLVLQLRSDRVDAVDLTTDRSAGETRVESAALLEAVERSAEDVPGVADASARLVQRRGGELLVLRVRLLDRTDLGVARERLAAGPVAQVRTALGSACPRLRVELEPTSDSRRTRELR